MRFFSGSRDVGSKKGSASAQYKEQLAAKNGKGPPPDPQAIYKQRIAERMDKMMEDILLGKNKKNSGIPGTKSGADEKPKEVSKTTLMMLRMLAERREQKERKDLRKREQAYKRQVQAKVSQEKQLKLQEELLIQQKEAEYRAEQERLNDPNKSSWW